MEYTQKDVISRLGLPRWQVQYYSDKGIVKPGYGFGGRGNARRYDETNLLQFSLIKSLSSWGLQAKDIEFVIRYLFERLVTVQGKGVRRGSRWDELQGKACYMVIFRGRSGDLDIELVVDRSLEAAFQVEKVREADSILFVDLAKIAKMIS